MKKKFPVHPSIGYVPEYGKGRKSTKGGME